MMSPDKPVRDKWDKIFRGTLYALAFSWFAFVGLILWVWITDQPSTDDVFRVLTRVEAQLKYLSCLADIGPDRTPVDIATCQVLLP